MGNDINSRFKLHYYKEPNERSRLDNQMSLHKNIRKI